MKIVGPLIVYSPSIAFAIAFAVCYRKEPRQFKNAVLLGFFLLTFLPALLMSFGQASMVAPLVFAILLAPFITIAFLFMNTFVVVKHEGLHLSTILPTLLALAIICWFSLFPVLIILRAPAWLMGIASLITAEGLWFFFTFVALLLYSTLYRLLPRKRVYNYIIIHGAGLINGKPTPLLRGRIEKAYSLWLHQNKQGKFVASGGQGSDEAVSEAQAIATYLMRVRDVPAEQILLEDKSTTTLENLSYSREIISADWSSDETYRTALVTSDYHVFRASEYAHQLGMKADGVGSHTRAYYWPTAFIREFIAVTKAHWMPYVIIAVLCLIPRLISLMG